MESAILLELNFVLLRWLRVAEGDSQVMRVPHLWNHGSEPAVGPLAGLGRLCVVLRETIATRCMSLALSQINTRPLFCKTLLNKFSHRFIVAKCFFLTLLISLCISPVAEWERF